MSTDSKIAYEDYLSWLRTLKNPVTPYSRKQWDTMPAINMLGIQRAMRAK